MSKEFLAKILTKKVIMIAVGVVVALELAWAGWTLTKPQPEKNIIIPKVPPSFSQSSSTYLALQSAKTQVKVGETIAVDIKVSSLKNTDGTDLVILYDPQLLSVILDNLKQPVKVGTIYNDYPLNSVDETNGRISVSGITSNPGGIVPEGIFGSVTFQAQKPGSTQLTFDFTPGNTVDSNVIETKTAKDLLGEVKNLSLTILP